MFGIHHLIITLGKALLCHCSVDPLSSRRIPLPLMSEEKYVHGGKGQNITVQSRKNFARTQKILLGVSKYPRLHSSLSGLCVCSQAEEAIGCCAWLEWGKPLFGVVGGDYF